MFSLWRNVRVSCELMEKSFIPSVVSARHCFLPHLRKMRVKDPPMDTPASPSRLFRASTLVLNVFSDVCFIEFISICTATYQKMQAEKQREEKNPLFFRKSSARPKTVRRIQIIPQCWLYIKMHGGAD